ncbi:MAG: DUF427 domain-containing protein, partial [Actinobacteria bacterium]|nr:DUF427 domain-containing protein [Actinomycetota bacterium]
AKDVRPEVLVPSATHTVCPYKGTASYHSLRAADGLIPDAAFCYPAPLDGAGAVKDRLCFLAEGVETRVDGQRRS